jgi:hypothetical protein
VNAPKRLKAPCPSGSHQAEVSTVTGLLKSHRHGGTKCPGSGKYPARRKL